MPLPYAVGDRVDGLYDGNSDDVWYPGVLTAVHDDGAGDVLYDDGETEPHVLPHYLRVHQEGTICVGSRVFGRYAGGEEWYAGKIQVVQDDGMFTIEYDDGEIESNVVMAFIKETLHVHESEEEEPADEVPAVESMAVETERSASPAVETMGNEEIVRDDTTQESTPFEENVTTETPTDGEEQDKPSSDINSVAELTKPPSPLASQAEDTESHDHQPAPTAEELPVAVVDDYANIFVTVERLETSHSDAVASKTLLSTLVKQMRTFPQATADLVHSRGGERLLMDILKQHHTHAVIQCYGFVLLRRLCFLCGKSTHYFLRNEIVELVTIAMRKFPEDAILQASACGALAVFTRVHAGLAALLENRISHLVLATIIFHKAYSVHTRQVHYYACEVLLELCELGDKTTIEALCGDSISGPGLSDLSPVSLLLFLLRQALSFEDKKACCAAGTLLMCLASCHRHAAQMVLDLNGLGELSTVMAKFPNEPGIQKYAASASREVALCTSSPHHHRGEANAMDDRHHQRQSSHRRSGTKTVGGTKRKAPSSQRSGVSSMNGFPSPGHQQQAGALGAHSRDALSFSKYASPIGKAPHLPPNIRPFGDVISAPSPSAAAYQQQQRSQVGSPLVILDSHGTMTSEKKRFVKEERTNLLFETYGVDAKSALHHHANANEYHTRTQGIKRRQLKTHIVSASDVGSGNDQISWASPVKSIILQDSKLQTSRSDKQTTNVQSSDARKVRSSGTITGGIDNDEQQLSPATLRRQQQAAIKTGKRRESDEKLQRSTAFQLKLDPAHATATSAGTASPIVLSPKSGRAGASHSRSKTSSRSKTNKPTTRTTLRDDASVESLNSYATQLFKDEMEASTIGNAQERERLTFAEKLHKMIDKAKSSLAHSSTVSLTSEAQKSPAKTTRRQEPASISMAKRTQPTPVSTSRVAPVSNKSSAGSDPTASISSTVYPSVPKKPVVAAKSTPAKKPIVATTSTPATIKPVVPPKNVKPSGSAGTRATTSSVVPKASWSTTHGGHASTKPASSVKTAVAEKVLSKAEVVPTTAANPTAVAAVAVAAAVVVAADAVHTVVESSTSALDVNEGNETSSQAQDKINDDVDTIVTAPTEVIENGKASRMLSEVLEPPASIMSSEALETVVIELPVSDETIMELVTVKDERAEAEDIATPRAELSLPPIDPIPADEINAGTCVEEAVAVASAAADELYADEYNDFDDLDNSPHMDDDFIETANELGRQKSFEALMNLTAQVTEFTAAAEPTIAPDIAVADPEPPATEDGITLGQDVSAVEESRVSVGGDIEAEVVVSESDQFPKETQQEPTDPGDERMPTEVQNETVLQAEEVVLKEDPTTITENHGADPIETVNVEPVLQDPASTTVDSVESDHAPEAEVGGSDKQEYDVSTDGELVSPPQENTNAMDGQQDDHTPTSLNADRPESRQTEASYADEDFDDSPDEPSADVEPEAASEEPTHDVDASEATFELAEHPLEPIVDVHEAEGIHGDEMAVVDNGESPSGEEAESVSHEPPKYTHIVAPEETEADEYGEEDFAGDESVPMAAAKDEELAVNATDAVVETDDAPMAAIEQNDAAVPYDSRLIDDGLTSVQPSTDASEAVTDKLIPSENVDTHADLEHVDEPDVSPAVDSLRDIEGETLVPAVTGERPTTSDGYGDADFEDDAHGDEEVQYEANPQAPDSETWYEEPTSGVGAEPGENKVEEIVLGDGTVSVSPPDDTRDARPPTPSLAAENTNDNDQLIECEDSPDLDDDVHCGVDTDGAKLGADTSCNIPSDDRAEEPTDEPTSDEAGRDDVLPEASATEREVVIETAVESAGTATDASTSEPVIGDITPTTQEVPLEEHDSEVTEDEDVSVANAENTRTVEESSEMTDRANKVDHAEGQEEQLEGTSSAQDNGSSPEENEVGYLSTGDGPPPATAMANDDNDFVSATARDGDQHDEQETERPATAMTYNDDEFVSATGREDDEQAELTRENERPASAMTYNDDDFDGETAREDEGTEQKIECEEPDIHGTTTAEAEITIDYVTEDEVVEPLVAIDTTRPTTADAYADEAEFEDEAASGDTVNPPVEVVLAEPAEATLDSITADNESNEQSTESSDQYIEEHMSQAQSSDVPLPAEVSDDILSRNSLTDANEVDMPQDVVEAQNVPPETTLESEFEPTMSSPVAIEEADATELEAQATAPSTSMAYENDIHVGDNDSTEDVSATAYAQESNEGDTTGGDSIELPRETSVQPEDVPVAETDDAVLGVPHPVETNALVVGETEDAGENQRDVDSVPHSPEPEVLDKVEAMKTDEPSSETAEPLTSTEEKSVLDSETVDASDSAGDKPVKPSFEDELQTEHEVPGDSTTLTPSLEQPSVESVEASIVDMEAVGDDNNVQPAAESNEPSTEIQAPESSSERVEPAVPESSSLSSDANTPESREHDAISPTIDAEDNGENTFVDTVDEAPRASMADDTKLEREDNGLLVRAEQPSNEESTPENHVETSVGDEDAQIVMDDTVMDVEASTSPDEEVHDLAGIPVEANDVVVADSAATDETHAEENIVFEENDQDARIPVDAEQQNGVQAMKQFSKVSVSPDLEVDEACVSVGHGDEDVTQSELSDQPTIADDGATTDEPPTAGSHEVEAQQTNTEPTESAENALEDETASIPSEPHVQSTVDAPEPNPDSIVVAEGDDMSEPPAVSMDSSTTPESANDAISLETENTRVVESEPLPNVEVLVATNAIEPKLETAAVGSTDDAVADASEGTGKVDEHVEPPSSDPIAAPVVEHEEPVAIVPMAQQELELAVAFSEEAQKTEDPHEESSAPSTEIQEPLVKGMLSDEKAEHKDEYAFEEEEPVSKEEVQEESVPVAKFEEVPVAIDDDEPLYKDDDNEFEEEKPNTPLPTEPITSASTTTDAAPSPTVDDAEYEDFEVDEPVAPVAAVPAKLTKQPTTEEIEDETAYDDDDAAFNEFEDDETRPPAKVSMAPAMATPSDDVEDAYDMDDGFDNEDNSSPRTTTPNESKPPNTPSPPADNGDYDAEYDEFED